MDSIECQGATDGAAGDAIGRRGGWLGVRLVGSAIGRRRGWSAVRWLGEAVGRRGAWPGVRLAGEARGERCAPQGRLETYAISWSSSRLVPSGD
jgi:hypothetical protein